MSNIPANLPSVIHDFAIDLTTTFPEYAFLWKKWTNPTLDARDLEDLFAYLSKVFPERFFDILYQNDEIFKPDNETNTQFLPNVEFKILFNCTDITETTRKAIWKYLQLILMTILKTVQDKTGFGDAASLFDGVDEEVLQEKLNDTLGEIGNFFKNLGEGNQDGSDNFFENLGLSGENPFDKNPFDKNPFDKNPFDKNLFEGFEGFGGENPFFDKEEFKKTFDFAGMQPPNAEELHDHLKGLFDGKIGSLAKELAEEISHDIEHMFEDESGGKSEIKSTQDLLKKMMKNPKKMLDIMKNIGGKLEQKMKSGEISQEELMKEASELMGKMKDGKGMGQFGEMFKNIAKGMGGGKAKFNSAAFSKMEKQMATKERMKYKLEELKEKKAATALEPTDDPNKMVFRLGDADSQAKSSLSDHDLINMFDKPEPKKKDPDAKSKKKKAKK
jgi:hypothetical protein